jgi:hypothetical protein
MNCAMAVPLGPLFPIAVLEKAYVLLEPEDPI